MVTFMKNKLVFCFKLNEIGPNLNNPSKHRWQNIKQGRGVNQCPSLNWRIFSFSPTCLGLVFSIKIFLLLVINQSSTVIIKSLQKVFFFSLKYRVGWIPWQKKNSLLYLYVKRDIKHQKRNNFVTVQWSWKLRKPIPLIAGCGGQSVQCPFFSPKS